MPLAVQTLRRRRDGVELSIVPHLSSLLLFPPLLSVPSRTIPFGPGQSTRTKVRRLPLLDSHFTDHTSLQLLLLLFKPSCLCSDPIGRAFPALPCLIIQLGDTDQLAMPMQCQVVLCSVVLCGPGLSWRS